jgi:tetratricopeptide (TPR) repeat protein
MSYIHEALLKAQKEKDARYPRYEGIFFAPKGKRDIFSVRPVWLICLFVIFLAFVLYSWLDFRGEKTVSTPKNPKPEVSSGSRISVNAKDLYERARHFQKIGRLKDARRLYQKVLTLHQGHVHALNNLGVIYIQERNYSEARKSLENAIQLKPEYVDPYYNLACLYAIKGEAEKSLGHLKTAVSLDQSVKDWARNDRDLQNLRGVPGFEEIIKTVK